MNVPAELGLVIIPIDQDSKAGGRNPPHHNPAFIETASPSTSIVPSLMMLIPNKRTMKLQKGVCSSSGAGSRKDKPTSLLSAKAFILIWSRS